MESEEDILLGYYRVLHSGGLVVRSAPNFTSEQTGEIVNFENIIITKDLLQVDSDKFVQLVSGGWVVAEKGSLRALEEVN